MCLIFCQGPKYSAEGKNTFPRDFLFLSETRILRKCPMESVLLESCKARAPGRKSNPCKTKFSVTEYIFPTRPVFSSSGKNSPLVEIFPREESAGSVERYFPLWKYKFPWIRTLFCPALITQLEECLPAEPRVQDSNPMSC